MFLVQRREMDHIRFNARAFFVVLYISQVCGSPTFYWSQPDCYQQSIDYTLNNYDNPSYQGDGYQKPSYQETLQSMVDETIRAISEIVQITARATKEELVSISKVIIQGVSGTNSNNCNTPSSENGDGNADYQFSESPGQTVQFPGPSEDSEYTKPIEPHGDSPVKLDIPIPTTTEKETTDNVTEPYPYIDVRLGEANNTSIPTSYPTSTPTTTISSNLTPTTITSTTTSTSNLNPTTITSTTTSNSTSTSKKADVLVLSTESKAPATQSTIANFGHNMTSTTTLETATNVSSTVILLTENMTTPGSFTEQTTTELTTVITSTLTTTPVVVSGGQTTATINSMTSEVTTKAYRKPKL